MGRAEHSLTRPSSLHRYPKNPIQKEVPVRAPTRQNGKAFATTSDTPLDSSGLWKTTTSSGSWNTTTSSGSWNTTTSSGTWNNTTSDTLLNSSGTWNTTQTPDRYIPGCSDFKTTNSATFGVSTVSNATTSCPDTSALSGVPYNVFSGGDLNPNIYDNFCKDIDGTVNTSTTVDSSGNPRTNSSGMRKFKRTPPANASSYSTFEFKLSWTNDGAENDGCGQTVESCRDAFANLTESSCGHQGGQQDILTAAGSINLPGCGTYSYLITGPDVPT